MARRGSRFVRNDSNRRKTQWGVYDPSTYVAVSSTGAVLLGGFVFTEASTVVRHRGRISVAVPTGTNTDLEFTGAWGVGVVSVEAFAAGVASIPEPYTDSDWGGWMVIQAFS